MKRYLCYLWYIVRHKYYVMIACFKIGASWRLALLHDLSKFMPAEFIPYANTFYAADGSKRYSENIEFACAWNKHQKRNKHHWQYWILTWDNGRTIALPMPSRYIYEMVADWMGAGRAITGKWEYRDWYNKNKEKMCLCPATRETIEAIINK